LKCGKIMYCVIIFPCESERIEVTLPQIERSTYSKMKQSLLCCTAGEDLIHKVNELFESSY
jgi:hypothetical protein